MKADSATFAVLVGCVEFVPEPIIQITAHGTDF